jgi:hypothetical protein
MHPVRESTRERDQSSAVSSIEQVRFRYFDALRAHTVSLKDIYPILSDLSFPGVDSLFVVPPEDRDIVLAAQPMPNY